MRISDWSSDVCSSDLFLDSEALSGQGGRDVDFLAVHADAPAACDEQVAVVERLVDLWYAVFGLGRGALDLYWGLHGDRVAGAFAVEPPAKLLETGYLSQHVCGWRAVGTLFLVQVHARLGAFCFLLSW